MVFEVRSDQQLPCLKGDSKKIMRTLQYILTVIDEVLVSHHNSLAFSIVYCLQIVRVAATTSSTWPLPHYKSSEMSSWNARALQKCHLVLKL